MTEKCEERQRRPRHDDDRDDDRDYGRPRPPRIETAYIFAFTFVRPEPPEVYGDRFWLGNVVSTSDGPYKVIEVYWITAHKARVLLRPVLEKKKLKRPKKKIQQPTKFNAKGTQTSRQPARHQNQGA
jgi:hypothetical protein